MEPTDAIRVAVGIFFWLIVYLFTYFKDKKKNPNHFDDERVSNMHNFFGMSLAAMSLYFNDESLFKEINVLSWCTGYFVADIIDCIVRKDVMFFIHAVIGFALLHSCSTSPFYELRAGSRGYFVELSSPFYQKWKRTKSKADLRNFLTLFFLCRLVWSPIFLWKVNASQNVFALAASAAFYILNFLWFGKGVSIFLNYKEGGREASKRDS